MPPQMPMWFQRLPSETRRRLDLAEAAALEARAATHAEQAMNMVAVFATRLPFDEAVDRYIEVMDLGGDEAEVVRTRALVTLSESEAAPELVRERHRTGLGFNWRYATPLGAMRFVRRRLRRNAEEDLWLELSVARAEEALIRTHMRHALLFVEILEGVAPPPRAVTLYLDQLEVPGVRARAVYQRSLARVAETDLPRGYERPEPPPPVAERPPPRRGRR